nr:MAG TPA: hypothetical protein [Caudoviricetes sp.]
MTTIDDLNNIEHRRTMNDWLQEFPPHEQETILTAIHTHPPGPIYKILAELDHNPLPFTRSSFNDWARKQREKGTHG